MATRPQEPPAAAQPEPVVCPRCSAEATHKQEYCLECGLRLRPADSVDAFRLGWQRRLGWVPGEWLLAVLLALLVAAAGAGLAIAFSRGGEDRATLVATSSVTSQAVPTVSVTTATLPTAPTETAPTQTQPTQTRPPPQTPIAWPAGRSGYTVVLNSIPRTRVGRTNALAQARVALRRGLAQVGVLDSSEFSSLHPGYWVVFSGVFRTQAAAQRHIARARRAAYQFAYVRPITS